MAKNLVTEVSLIVLLPTLISGKFKFLLKENSMYLVLPALMIILFDFSHLSRHFSSLFISSAESKTLSPGTQVGSVLLLRKKKWTVFYNIMNNYSIKFDFIFLNVVDTVSISF